MDGDTYDWAPVQSRVPQGTFLGPILLLAFINNLPRSVKSNNRLFADDCVIYWNIKSEQFCVALQQDLAQLVLWEDRWSMSFNADKCSTIVTARNKKKINAHTLCTMRFLNEWTVPLILGKSCQTTEHGHDILMKANLQLAFL